VLVKHFPVGRVFDLEKGYCPRQGLSALNSAFFLSCGHIFSLSAGNWNFLNWWQLDLS
jgi:hypothetical protein